jgi:DNA-binding HxlR family transcriptional regulator
MVRYAETSREYSSISRVAAILCEPWTLLIVREAFLGTTRFEQFQSTLGTPRSLLSDRLRKLVANGILTTAPYLDSAGRKRQEYQLSPSGRDLFSILMSVRVWGDRHLAPDGPPELWHHEGCGGSLTVEVVCDRGHRNVSELEFIVESGPGARLARRLDESADDLTALQYDEIAT